MEQKDKELLLKDLCARLPYGVKVKTNNINVLKLGTHTRVGEYVTDVTEPCKPYLFPLSGITEEQKEDMIRSSCGIGSDKNVFDWYNKNHLDYRGLIPMGLAIDATGLNIY